MTAEVPAPRSPFATRPARRRPHRRWDLIVVVGVGGTVGTLARYEIGLVLPAPKDGFPWAIFAVNVVGALIVGVVTTLVLERWPPTRYARPLIGIGFCGGLTTFSTWMVDTTQLIDRHRIATAILYVVATLVAGFAALYAGVLATRTVAREGARS